MVENTEKTPQKKLRFLQKRKGKPRLSTGDSLGIFVMGTLVAQGLVLLFQLLLYGNYNQLANKPAPTLVQLASGEAIAATPLSEKERTPEVVKTFVSKTLTTMFSWSGYLPGDGDLASHQPDPGMKLEASGSKIRVATPAWQAAFALSEDFRTTFLAQLAKMTPPGIFNGRQTVVFLPLEIAEPVRIEEGKWKVNVVANLMVFSDSNKTGVPITFNKSIYVQTVSVPEYPEFHQDPIARTIAKIRAAGLEIYHIKELL